MHFLLWHIIKCNDKWHTATGWSHVAGAARSEDCAVIHVIRLKNKWRTATYCQLAHLLCLILFN